MAQRTLACTGFQGRQGRVGTDGYHPRTAGKPVGYLYNQLLSFSPAPDRMAQIASRLEPQDLAAATVWLAAQSLPADPRPNRALSRPTQIACGSASVPPGSPTP